MRRTKTVPIGFKHERLTVVEHLEERSPNGSYLVKCRCSCSRWKYVIVRRCDMVHRRVKSCGCAQRDAVRAVMTKHGQSGYHSKGDYCTVEYKAWLKMKGRCYNEDDKSYERYGGRGIRVCKRWRSSFQAFFEDMGKRPSRQHSIDRVDNDGHYLPKNCKWSTKSEQMNNRGSFNRIVDVDGEQRTLTEWCEHYGVERRTAYSRLARGWSERDAVTLPVRQCRPGKRAK